MYHEMELLIIMILGAFLLVAKTDWQIVHILEGSLLKKGRDTSEAKKVYKKHAKISSIVFFMLGSALAAIAIMLQVNENDMFVPLAIISFTLLGLGIRGRMISFRAAAREINERQ